MKKLKAIVSALLVVVSIFAFTACDATFNGNFKEEATEEQLTQIKSAAGSSYSEAIEEEEGHGWVSKVNYEASMQLTDTPYTVAVKSESQIGVDKDNKAQYAVKADLTMNGNKANVATYAKDGDLYVKVNDKQGKVTTALTGQLADIKEMSYVDEVLKIANQALGYVTTEGTAAVETPAVKVYVDASGDTFKIKYVFDKDAISGQYSGLIDGADAQVTWKSSEQSVIVVYNKDLTKLKGIKVVSDYSFSVTDGEDQFSVSYKINASVESTNKAVKYPNLSKYEDLKPSDILEMGAELAKLAGM